MLSADPIGKDERTLENLEQYSYEMDLCLFQHAKGLCKIS